MGASASREHARARRRLQHGRIGDRALDFARWFARSKYALMAGFLGELEESPQERDPRELHERYVRALARGERALRVRAGVTVLLALGVLAAMATTLVRLTDAPTVLEIATLLDRLAAISASVSVVLVVLRLACDRYIERVDIAATFLALQLATTPRPKVGERSLPASPR